MLERNFNLQGRKENTREKLSPPIIRFGLEEIMHHFNETVEAIKAQFTVTDELSAGGKVSESENIWRAQIVFLAAAIDFFMHELTKYGLCEIYEEHWQVTEQYKNITVTMSIVTKVLKSDRDENWFLEYINGYYKNDTLISYENIKRQLNLLGINIREVADRAFYDMHATERTIDKLKRRLNSLYARRNIIAHQTDRAHENAQMAEISQETVLAFIEDAEKIVRSITDVAAEKSC